MTYSIILMLLRYLVCAVVSVLATLITWLGSPIWAALSFTTRDGNLPRWCYWLQTHDAPLDELWVKGRQYINGTQYVFLNKWRNELETCIFTEFVPSTMFKYVARTCWLFRNPAYGVANQLGIDRVGLIELRQWVGKGWDLALFQTPAGQYGFTLKAEIDWAFGRYVRVRLGYKRIGNEPRMMLATHINPFRKKQESSK